MSLRGTACAQRKLDRPVIPSNERPWELLLPSLGNMAEDSSRVSTKIAALLRHADCFREEDGACQWWFHHARIKRCMPKIAEHIHTHDWLREMASSSDRGSHCLFFTDHHWYGHEAPAHIRSIQGLSGNPVVEPEWLTQVKRSQSSNEHLFHTDHEKDR